MAKHNIQGYLIPRTDPHQSEYIAEYWESVAWFTGFTGSAANVVVTNDFSGVWTDSRYFIQGEQQLHDTPFELMRLKVPHTPGFIDWILDHLSEGDTVGVDGKLLSRKRYKLLEKKLGQYKIKLNPMLDLISPVWEERPVFPDKQIFDHPVIYCGKSRAEKLAEVRAEMALLEVDAHVISSLDDIAWLLNIRGLDTLCTPVALSYFFLSKESAFLFIHQEKVPNEMVALLKADGVSLLPYNDLDKFLATVSASSKVLIDPSRSSQWVFQSIPVDCDVVEQTNITTHLKAIKNEVEISNIRKAMLKDGIALTKFLMWLEANLGEQQITEMSAAEKLESFRKEQGNYLLHSFSTIAGYQEHGAIVHYRPTKGTDLELRKEGLFLLDSGGQYLEGTTDITRTLALGTPTAQQKSDFTLVLKGHIQLAMQQFPVGTKGYQLDVLARQAMWQHGINYGHGTGHGVGFCLNVHEGPQSISGSKAGATLQPGMLTSNEPGIYREGFYGIRTENLVLTVEKGTTEFGTFLGFETVTFCPIDLTLIDAQMLTKKELDWLNAYHQDVYELLSPHLSVEENAWLKDQTILLEK